MHPSLSLPQISTNVRFAATALFAPDLAGAWAERLFLTPPRMSDPSRLPVSTFFDFLDAHAGFVEFRGRQLATWRWGPLEAPAVVLAHGWGGYAAQMRGFVPRLLAEGYRVIAYDDAGQPSAPDGAVLHVDGRVVRMQGATQTTMACVGAHRGLVRATAPGTVRSNALR